VDAGDFGTRPPHQFIQSEVSVAAHEPIHGQRPLGAVNTRYTEMTEYDRILDPGHAIEQLMRLKRVTAKGLCWIERCAGHSRNRCFLERGHVSAVYAQRFHKLRVPRGGPARRRSVTRCCNAALDA
jgi:hypothetical protein